MSFKKKRCRRAGFSLIELMTVLAIIGLLATVASFSVQAYMTKARQKTARADISVIMHNLDVYAADSKYPTADEGLGALTRTSTKCPEPLMKNIPNDPWGNPYVYVVNGPRSVEVLSYGADGAAGGTGADEDISSNNNVGGR